MQTCYTILTDLKQTRCKMIKIDIRKSKNCNEDYAMYISFDYDSYIVNTIKSLSTRFYNADNKEWEVSIRFFETLIEKFSNYDITIMNYERVNQLLDKDENAITFDNFKFKTKPFAHQIEGFNYGLNHDKWLLGDEQGLGNLIDPEREWPALQHSKE